MGSARVSSNLIPVENIFSALPSPPAITEHIFIKSDITKDNIWYRNMGLEKGSEGLKSQNKLRVCYRLS
jgi:hypothetical protein